MLSPERRTCELHVPGDDARRFRRWAPMRVSAWGWPRLGSIRSGMAAPSAWRRSTGDIINAKQSTTCLPRGPSCCYQFCYKELYSVFDNITSRGRAADIPVPFTLAARRSPVHHDPLHRKGTSPISPAAPGNAPSVAMRRAAFLSTAIQSTPCSARKVRQERGRKPKSRSTAL